MSDLPAPAPATTPDTERFWEATAEETLLVRHCTDCEEAHHYPRAICPHCHSDAVEWIEASGRGTIYTYTVIQQNRGDFGEATPYVLAYVELEEGPRVMTNVVDADIDAIEIGQSVEVVFDETGEGVKLPRFRPT